MLELSNKQNAYYLNGLRALWLSLLALLSPLLHFLGLFFHEFRPAAGRLYAEFTRFFVIHKCRPKSFQLYQSVSSEAVTGSAAGFHLDYTRKLPDGGPVLTLL